MVICLCRVPLRDGIMTVFGKVFTVIATLAGLCFVANLVLIITHNDDRPVASTEPPASAAPRSAPLPVVASAPETPPRSSNLSTALAASMAYTFDRTSGKAGPSAGIRFMADYECVQYSEQRTANEDHGLLHGQGLWSRAVPGFRPGS